MEAQAGEEMQEAHSLSASELNRKEEEQGYKGCAGALGSAEVAKHADQVSPHAAALRAAQAGAFGPDSGGAAELLQ